MLTSLSCILKSPNNIYHICVPASEARGRVHHIQAVEHSASPGGCGAGPPEDPQRTEAGVP